MKLRYRNLPAALRSAGITIAAIVWLGSLAVYPAHTTPTTPPPAPELLSPESGATTTGLTDPPVGVPRLRWAAVADATRYHIQVSSSAGFATILEESDTYATEYTPYKRSYADGTYYWHVKSGNKTEWGNYSDAWSFDKDWTAGGALRPSLLTPSGGTVLQSFAEFTWSAVTGAAQYLFEINDDPSFPSPADYSATTVKPTHTPVNKLGNNLYYWRVTPLDRSGNRGVPSDVSQFRLNWNERPELLSPDDNAVLVFTPQFDWTAVEGAKYYYLEISTGPDFSTTQRRYEPRNTSFTPDQALSNDQEYYWRVQAVDSVGNKGPYSPARRFEIRWHLAPRLLSPTNNWIHAAAPLLRWAPVPGAHRYEIQVDESPNFADPLFVRTQTPMTSYAPGNEGTQLRELVYPGTYYWRVRAVDNQNNVTPWSETRAYRYDFEVGPQPIYPPFYYSPQADLMPVYSDPTVASPLFIWDTAHDALGYRATHFPAADYYTLQVADNPDFNTPGFSITTASQAAAPTTSNPFAGPTDGQTYYWRVRAFENGAQMGVDTIWQTRIDSTLLNAWLTDVITPIYPADGHEMVVDAPVLGWLPVRGATRYRVQVSSDRNFTDIVDDAYPTFVHYVPYQGRTERLPNRTYYWRVRTEQPLGNWSEPRYFNVSHQVQTINPYDYPLSGAISTDPVNRVAGDSDEGLGAYELTGLYLALDRTDPTALRWVIAADVANPVATELNYGFYVDTDHVAGSGADRDPPGHPITVYTQYRPEYALYAHRRADGVFDSARIWTWQGSTWSPPQDLASVGGTSQPHNLPNVLELYLPYTAFGSGNPDWPGSLAVVAFTTGVSSQDGIHDTVPGNSGNHLARFALTGDSLNPIYPFDMPLTGSGALYDQPALVWLMPYWHSVDGYYTQIARDPRFTDLVDTYEIFESAIPPVSAYSFLLTARTPIRALADNETYYWRSRVRHERYTNDNRFFDYGPFSRAFRFKLDSRRPDNLYVTPSNPVYGTPTFHWDRVEGAGVYRLQVDDDENFSSPIISLDVDLTSYTPEEKLIGTFADGTYYWHVAIKRDNNNYGKWSATQTFTRVSPVPEPISPRDDETVNGLPTFRWQPVLVPGEEPRRAAPRYRLMVDDDPNFSTPSTYDTDATGYTPRKGEKYKDGTWYWKVAMLDSANHLGPYSPPQRFYKEYLPPTLISPAQGSSTPGIPTFIWQPVDGAAQYRLQIDDNEFFSSPESYTTDNTTFTPVTNLGNSVYFWRVQMIDVDGQPGPFTVGRLRIGNQVYLPVIVKN
jgi:hypothetical protein